MSLTLKEAIQARKLKLIATELEPLARQDRTVKKIVDTLKKGKEPNPDDINSLKGDTQDDVVMAFASVLGPSKTSDFLGEGKEDPDIGDRKGSQPAGYHKGLAASTKEKRDAQFKKQAEMSDDDPAAYKPAPGDKEAKTKPSKYTKKYDKMFGEETLEESSTKKALQKKSEETGVAYSILKDVYDRGVAAWRTGHRPGTTPAQWGMARVNSFVTGGKTQKTADADLWKKHKGQNEEVELKENLFKKIKAIRDKKKRMKEIDKELKQLDVDWQKAGPKDEKDWSFIDRRADISSKEKKLARELMKLRNEEVDLNEAVRVDDSRYKRSHKKAPKGKGLWGFTVKPMGTPKESETYMPALAMDYKKALEMGKKWAERQGSSVVYVMESTSKNTAQGYANRGRSTFKSMHKMVKGLVRADDDMVTHYLDSTHGRHLGDAERDMSAAKLKDYIKKDFAMFKKKYDPKLFEANAEDMQPASPDEKSMALKQAEFIQYVGREIGEHLVANKEFPEWMQNKLSALHQKAKDMHATLGAHGETFEEVELDEAKTIKVSFRSAAAKNKWMKKQSITPKEIISQSSTMIELPASMKQYTQKKDHDEIYQVKESVELDESRIADAAMFLKRVLGFENRYERFERRRKEAAQKLKKSDIEGFVKDAEPFLNFIKGGKANYYKSLLNKLKASAKDFDPSKAIDQMIEIRNYISKNKSQVRKEEVEMSNYNYRTGAHTPMHVSKAIRVAKQMGGNMTGAVDKIEKMAKGLSEHPKVKAALRMANEDFDFADSKQELLGEISKELAKRAFDARAKKSEAERQKRDRAAKLKDKVSAKSSYSSRSRSDDEKITKARDQEGASQYRMDRDEKKLQRSQRKAGISNDDAYKRRQNATAGQRYQEYRRKGGKLSMNDWKKHQKESYEFENIDDLIERAESEAQAVAARIALKHKREGTKPEPGTASAEMMKMSEKDLEDFTKVKKGAPEKVEEATELMESHFKVGDKVTCIASGMKGEVIKLDEPQTGKYYTVRREDGKVMKYASDELKKVMKEALDDVDKAALKKKFKNRKDKDIDNDGDVDSSDEYLHKRRSAISKAIAKEESETKLKEKDVDKDGDADDLDKSLEKRKQKVLDTD